MDANTYGTSNLTRTPVVPGAWNPVIIPQGAKDALLTLEDQTASWRLSPDNTIPLTGGTFVGATFALVYLGTAAAPILVYVNPSAPSDIAVNFQVDH